MKTISIDSEVERNVGFAPRNLLDEGGYPSAAVRSGCAIQGTFQGTICRDFIFIILFQIIFINGM